jgi:DNA replication protein DnaC
MEEKLLEQKQISFAKYRRVRYLVIDEFTDRGTSDWESRCLVNLIDHRYDDMLITVIIANLTETQIAGINPSIFDRAKETGGIINCDWLSYRN